MGGLVDGWVRVFSHASSCMKGLQIDDCDSWLLSVDVHRPLRSFCVCVIF